MEQEQSQEEIDKLLKSLESLLSFIGPQNISVEEMIEINDNIIESNKEFMGIVEKQNARWVDIYSRLKNDYCKILIKNLIEKNFLQLKELEKDIKAIEKNNQDYKKMI